MKKPVKVQSLRAVTGHLGSREPTVGNRYLVNALVTFRSMQVRFSVLGFFTLSLHCLFHLNVGVY